METIEQINQERIQRMTELLQQALQPSQLQLVDDSHLHAGHAGARSGKGHFTLVINSSSFAGLSRIKQHQLIYQTLGEMMQTDIHALSIRSGE